MHRFYLVLAFAGFLFSQDVSAQNRADRRAIKQLKEDITYLASDELEGRRVGSEGERKAAAYIEQRYNGLGIPGYKGKYQYPFLYIDGKQIADATQIKLGNDLMRIKVDAFPLAFSANKRVYGEVIPDVYENGNIWMMPMYTDKEEAADAHFDWEKKAYEKAKEAQRQGATAVLFYDNYNAKFAPAYNPKSEYDLLEIPAGFLNFNAYQAYMPKFKNRSEIPVDMNILLKRSELTGHNVTAFIDNNAAYTVVLGAHYDHLGYGEDGNSLHAAKDHKIHNGADDNASGTAALIQLADWVKKNKLRNYNYLFISFSGEEEGLIGSKAIVKEMGFDSNKIAYMINMDMVGRLNDSTHALTIGGIGTSPTWPQFTKPKNFKISVDSSGAGPSDHTSFYRAGIPVLFFFTGLHTDYHKPSDDAEKINYEGEVQVMHYIYDIVSKMDKQPRPAFRTTKEATVGKVRFKVTLGIMPDYSFQEGGVKVDGVTDGKPAVKAGIKAGDVITRLGEHKVNGMQTYMEALGAFKEGDRTEVTVIRDGKELQLPIEFK
jgi:hypothetical protein